MHSKKIIQMPEKLSSKDVNNIVYIFKTMSGAAKHDFLSSLIMQHPDHYKKISKALGKEYKKSIGLAWTIYYEGVWFALEGKYVSIPTYIIDNKSNERRQEIQLEIPNYSQQYYEYLEKKQEKEQNNKPETVIHIQIY